NIQNLRIDLKVKGKIVPTVTNVRGVRDGFNNEIGYVLVLRDIENDLKTEAMLNGIEKMQTLGQLTAGVTHQINNYLHVLVGTTDLLSLDFELGADRSTISEGIENIQTAIGKISELTKHLTAFARAQETPEVSLGDVNGVIDNIMALIRQRVKTSDVQVTVELRENIPPAHFSPLHLEQAVLNVVMNAIDAMAGRQGRLTISSLADKNWVKIVVADNGCGIPPEIKERVFEPFMTTKPVGMGTGLGLAVARKAVSAGNGTIEIDSTVGEGTTVTIKLPRENTGGE
ncbi:sensor histidine kinase, partial [Candidatus Sumerlaeota bacterium]